MWFFNHVVLAGNTQRAVVVFTETEGAVAALQANGRDILGSNCTVSLASSMPLLSDGSLATDNVSDEATSGAEGKARKSSPKMGWSLLSYLVNLVPVSVANSFFVQNA